ncbi:FKBP-type peptidyl-prolyl cis-trans isomerase [Lutibacter sp.]|uniref:FKBP-type peptidyl-prolyl cis-trans isomerase n=1 Tax=Lutibacter sp. TaxID=1925666 RepID=UPI0027329A00|nr:FKBP-type peptidyl-prolyl cis-trans isomerase [Lutibacter sp.]MDP3313145.1 FKBP-type peptidyl-prolyl cis-trans isomerase [Lutibacter sp.]
MKSFVSLLLIILFVSCNNNESNSNPQTEADIIKYIKDHNLTAQKSSTGLYYVINKQGEGAKPSSNSNVTVSYKGYFINGTVFDQSNAAGISFNLQQVIKGWTEGITYFNEGGEGMLLIPSQLGYGSTDRNGIPGGSVLLFDIKLLKVN